MYRIRRKTKVHNIRYSAHPGLKKESQRPSFLEVFKDFLTNSSMHGLKYIGKDNRPIFERFKEIVYYLVVLFSFIILFRIWWTVMFGVAVIISGYFCSKMLIKFYNAPVRFLSI